MELDILTRLRIYRLLARFRLTLGTAISQMKTLDSNYVIKCRPFRIVLSFASN